MLYLLSYGHQARMGFYQRKDVWQSTVCARIFRHTESGWTATPKHVDLRLVLAVDSRFRGNDGGEKDPAFAWRSRQRKCDP